MDNTIPIANVQNISIIQLIALGVISVFTIVTIIIAALGIFRLANNTNGSGVYASFASGMAAIVGIFLTSWSLYQSQAISEKQIKEKHKLRSWEWYNSVGHVADDTLSYIDEGVFSKTDGGKVDYSSELFQEAKPRINSLIEELVQEARHPPTGMSKEDNEEAKETLDTARKVKSKWVDIETRDQGEMKADDQFIEKLTELKTMSNEHKSDIYPERSPEVNSNE